MEQTFYSNGKLLLTSEYAILDGAKGLVLPTTYGQALTVKPIARPEIIWTSYLHDNTLWFTNTFKLNAIISNSLTKNSSPIIKRLHQILNAVQQLNPDIFSTNGYRVQTKLSFPVDWGLGSSSTLISNIARWADINPYKLLQLTFKGSGYDIAATQHNQPITYKLTNTVLPTIDLINFNPPFLNQLYVVYLNKKQSSERGISDYNAVKPSGEQLQNKIDELSELTDTVLKAETLAVFSELINKHELLISSLIKQQPVKERLFSDFNGAIKSLGAWGGDFILATSLENPKYYFSKRGFSEVYPLSEFMLK